MDTHATPAQPATLPQDGGPEETAPVTLPPGDQQIVPLAADPTGADLPWATNPAFTRKEAFDMLRRGHVPMTPEIAQQAAAMLLQGVPQKEIARALGYSESYAGKLVHSPQVRSVARRALIAAGVDEARLASKVNALLDAKKTEFAKYKGELGESVLIDDNGTQLATAQLAYEILGHKAKDQEKADHGPKMVINLSPKYEAIFFADPNMVRKDAPAEEPVDVTPSRDEA